jgi:tRNA nucleotidyltransferase/poly(A) polymerase
MLFHITPRHPVRGEAMEGNASLRPGLEADVDGHPVPPHVALWLDRLPSDLIEALNRFADHGHGVWIVGGSVRDALLQRRSTDIDLATTCPPEVTLALFEGQAIDTGSAFGTVTLKGDGALYEVTTLRTESVYRDGRRPEHVEWGHSLLEDLSRRDFTINSMAIDAARQTVHDPFQGQHDLQTRSLRAVGEAMQRCEEDALRILRAYRFLRLDDGPLWTMDPRLQLAVRQQRERLRLVSVERHWMELQKILELPGCGSLLRLMQNDGVLSTIFNPELPIDENILAAMDRPELDDLEAPQRLAMATVNHPTKALLQAMNHLRTSREIQRQAARFHEHLQHLPRPNIGALRVFAHVLGAEADAHLAVRTVLHEHGVKVGHPSEHPLVQVLEAWQGLPQRASPLTSLVDGHWLMQRAGLDQGMRLGRLKEWLHRLQVERDLTTLTEMEQLLSRLPYEHGDHRSWPQLSFP